MKQVIMELEEQLRYAETEDQGYAAQLRKAIQILKDYTKEEER